MEYSTETTDTEKPETNTYLLFLAVFLSLLNNNLTAVLNYVFNASRRLLSSSNYNQLRVQLQDLVKESTKIDMTDEFAKYARLQRKIIKIQEELKTEIKSQTESDMKNKFYIKCVIGLIVAVLMYLYNSQPVVSMPEDWLYPVSGFLCWPTVHYGTISFLAWCAISNSVVTTFT